MDKEGLLRQIDRVSFMLTDLGLYLDTHPDDKEAVGVYHTYRQKRRELLTEFETNFYPLTMDCLCVNPQTAPASALDRATNKHEADTVWCWGNGSEPWKGTHESAKA